LGVTVSHSVAGQTWRETIPFSFERLYKLVPAVARIEPHVPCEPYDMSVWPIRRLPRSRAEIRYQLHTRNIELLPFVRALSRAFDALTFELVSLCLDDGEIASYRVCDGSVHRWILPQARREVHWERARQEFGLVGDAVYEDDGATDFAEGAMLEEALDHWQRKSHGRQRPKARARNWWNRPVSRDLETEQTILLAQIDEGQSGSETD
jgi:hypothetical protein